MHEAGAILAEKRWVRSLRVGSVSRESRAGDALYTHVSKSELLGGTFTWFCCACNLYLLMQRDVVLQSFLSKLG